jgi:hypothetical protein
MLWILFLHNFSLFYAYSRLNQPRFTRRTNVAPTTTKILRKGLQHEASKERVLCSEIGVLFFLDSGLLFWVSNKCEVSGLDCSFFGSISSILGLYPLIVVCGVLCWILCSSTKKCKLIFLPLFRPHHLPCFLFPATSPAIGWLPMTRKGKGSLAMQRRRLARWTQRALAPKRCSCLIL